jgi:myosin heavy subunit
MNIVLESRFRRNNGINGYVDYTMKIKNNICTWTNNDNDFGKYEPINHPPYHVSSYIPKSIIELIKILSTDDSESSSIWSLQANLKNILTKTLKNDFDDFILYHSKEKNYKLKETEDKLKETDDKLKKTYDKLKETDDKLKKSYDKLKEQENKLKETEDILKEQENKLKKTDDRLKEQENKLKKQEKEYKLKVKERSLFIKYSIILTIFSINIFKYSKKY